MHSSECGPSFVQKHLSYGDDGGGDVPHYYDATTNDGVSHYCWSGETMNVDENPHHVLTTVLYLPFVDFLLVRLIPSW